MSNAAMAVTPSQAGVTLSAAKSPPSVWFSENQFGRSMNMLNVPLPSPTAPASAESAGAFLSARRFTLIGMNRLMAFSPFFTKRPFSRQAFCLLASLGAEELRIGGVSL